LEFIANSVGPEGLGSHKTGPDYIGRMIKIETDAFKIFINDFNLEFRRSRGNQGQQALVRKHDLVGFVNPSSFQELQKVNQK